MRLAPSPSSAISKHQGFREVQHYPEKPQCQHKTALNSVINSLKDSLLRKWSASPRTYSCFVSARVGHLRIGQWLDVQSACRAVNSDASIPRPFSERKRVVNKHEGHRASEFLRTGTCGTCAVAVLMSSWVQHFDIYGGQHAR